MTENITEQKYLELADNFKEQMDEKIMSQTN